MSAEKEKACPDLTRLLAFPSEAENAEICELVAHLYSCGKCRKTFERMLYPQDAWQLPDDERKTIADFVASHCKTYNPLPKLRQWIERHGATSFGQPMGVWRQAAAVGNKASEAEPLTLVFVSDEEQVGPRSWRAELNLPAVMTPGAKVPITVAGGDGMTGLNGVFVVCSQRVPIAEGRGEMSYQSFVAGLRDSTVVFRFADGVESAGALALL